MARTKRLPNRGDVRARKAPFRLLLNRQTLKCQPRPGVRKQYRFKPGTKALREIRKQQKNTDLLIPKAPFQRLVRELSLSFRSDLRFEQDALLCIQEAAEAHLLNMFQHSNNLAIHTGRKTIQDRDMKMACGIREDNTNPVYYVPPVRGSRSNPISLLEESTPKVTSSTVKKTVSNSNESTPISLLYYSSSESDSSDSDDEDTQKDITAEPDVNETQLQESNTQAQTVEENGQVHKKIIVLEEDK